MCKTIHRKVRFKAAPKDIYSLLTESKKYGATTAHKAQIGRNVGDKFSTFDGQIQGINVDLVPGKRVVQAWRSVKFPKGIFSMATFLLSKTPRGGTELELIHRGVPKALIPEVEAGWRWIFKRIQER